MKYKVKVAGITLIGACFVGGCGRTARIDNWPVGSRIEVQSEMLSAITYDEAGNVLTVELDDGTIQKHYGVPEKVYDLFMTSLAKGGFYTKNIKSVYRLVESIEWQGVDMIPIESTVFDAVYYDQSNKVLSLMLEGGSVEQFQGVPEGIYRGFMDAAIKGSYYSGYVKDYYTKPDAIIVPSPSPVNTPAVGTDVEPADKENKKKPTPKTVAKDNPGKLDPNAPMGVKRKTESSDPASQVAGASAAAVVADKTPKPVKTPMVEKPVVAKPVAPPKKEVTPVKELKQVNADDLDALLSEFNQGTAPVEKKEEIAPEKVDVPEVKKVAKPATEKAEPQPSQDDLDALLGTLDEPVKATPIPEEVTEPATEDAVKPMKETPVKSEPTPPANTEDDLSALLGELDASSEKAADKVNASAEEVKKENMPEVPAVIPASETGGDDLDALLQSLDDSSASSESKVKEVAAEVKAEPAAPDAPKVPVKPEAKGDDDSIDNLLKSLDGASDDSGKKVEEKAKAVAGEAAKSSDNELDDLLKSLEQ
jgi:hypothetical protein